MKNDKKDSEKLTNTVFELKGVIKREQAECEPAPFSLTAYAFDKSGEYLSSTEIDQSGHYALSLDINQPVSVDLVIGPPGDAAMIRRSSAYSHTFVSTDWQEKSGSFTIKHDAILPLSVWHPWSPQRICINGHIRKVINTEEGNEYCPVPFVKVEIFDVDRESCLWPWFKLRPELVLDRPIVRLPDLIEKQPVNPPIPFPDPRPLADPLPDLDPLSNLTQNPTARFSSLTNLTATQALNGLSAFNRVGEVRQLHSNLANRLDKLTVTSLAAPWKIFPHCFFSKAKVCETTTDCDGYFNCCFNWWPFHFRHGRLRFDARPDIIIKVTQVINGVSQVIYMDPYTSTRWNVNNVHIDLFLDDEEIICGNGQCYQPPVGSAVFFTRIGDDEVFQISQTTGLFTDNNYTDMAYGSSMNVHGQFGDLLTRNDPAGAGPDPHYFYRLSYAKQGSANDEFKFVDVSLNDTRVHKATLNAESHTLGPFTVNNIPSLYEVRNFKDYYWYNPDWIGIFISTLAEKDTGQYILRLEVFDASGTKINSAANIVDYRNGAGTGNGSEPTPLPAMVDHCDLLMTLDNKSVNVELAVNGVTNDCGVIPWSNSLVLDALVSASQENNRLSEWRLWYTKGTGVEQFLAASVNVKTAIPNVNNHLVPASHIIAGLTTTCAYALRLRGWAHIRNGRHRIYIDQDIDAIAIEKCA